MVIKAIDDEVDGRDHKKASFRGEEPHADAA